MFTAVVTTTDKYEGDVYTESGLIDTSKTKVGLKEYQRVVAVGSNVRDIKVGDLVCINPKRFAIPKHNEGSLKNGVVSDNMTIQYNFDIIEIDDNQCLLLQDRDIDFIIEEYEEIEEPTTTLVMPAPNKLIV
jgi:hypothetical protein